MAVRTARTPNLRIKCAAALLALTDDIGERLIPHEHAKAMSADQIISLFQFDHHPIRAEAGGPTEPWNLDPRLIPAHRIKSAKKDMPEIAKIRRLTKAEEDFRRRMLTPKDQRKPHRSRWPKRKIGSR